MLVLLEIFIISLIISKQNKKDLNSNVRNSTKNINNKIEYVLNVYEVDRGGRDRKNSGH